MAEKDLTPLQERFCHEYVVDVNTGAAAKRAGSRAKVPRIAGFKWLLLPAVQKRVQELYDARNRAADLDAVYVIRNLRNIVERCTQAVPVLDRDGEPTGEWRFRPSDANKALELLGRHLGLWNDKLTLQLTEAKARELIQGVIKIIFRHVTDETALAAIKGDIQELMGGGDA